MHLESQKNPERGPQTRPFYREDSTAPQEGKSAKVHASSTFPSLNIWGIYLHLP